MNDRIELIPPEYPVWRQK